MVTVAERKRPSKNVKAAKPRSLVAQVKAAVKAAPWITPADQATVALAVKLAKELEGEIDPRLGKLLVDVLSSLGLTVSGRGTKPQEPAPKVGTLDGLIARSGRRTNPTTGDPTPRAAKSRR